MYKHTDIIGVFPDGFVMLKGGVRMHPYKLLGDPTITMAKVSNLQEKFNEIGRFGVRAVLGDTSMRYSQGCWEVMQNGAVVLEFFNKYEAWDFFGEACNWDFGKWHLTSA